MKIINLYNFFDKKFPFKNQEKWDNAKLNTKSFLNHKLKNILIALDLNLDVIEEAIKNNCNVIITHHPIFINIEDKQLLHIKKLRKLLSKNKITHFPLHTNYDISNHSMSFKLLKMISNKTPIKNSKNDFGWISSFENNLSDLINSIKNNWKIDYLIAEQIENKKIENVYFCSGACSSEVEKLLHDDLNIDVYITGEVKWNVWNLAKDKNKIIFDVGHNVESFFKKDIHDILNDKKINSIIYKKGIYLKNHF